MIEINGVSKRYFGVPVLEDISFLVDTASVCGLIGYNGAGKTTLLHVIAGVYLPEHGSVLLDGVPVWENAKKKSEIFLLTDNQYFLPGATLETMRRYYAGYVPSWSNTTYARLCAAFCLPRDIKIEAFSRGMRRQAGIILAFSARPQYLLLDEVYDGLDLMMRRALSTLLAEYVHEMRATVVVTSHNLRELEEGIDNVVMLRQNRVSFVGSVAAIQEEHGTLEEYFLGERELGEAAFKGVFC